jgi:hypothetical protein
VLGSSVSSELPASRLLLENIRSLIIGLPMRVSPQPIKRRRNSASSRAARSLPPAADVAEVHGLGLDAAQGLVLTEGYYWDHDAKAALRRTLLQANRLDAEHDPGRHLFGDVAIWKAVKAAGTKDNEAVAKKLKELPVDDDFAQGGKVLENGRMVHDLYLFEVKKPSDRRSRGLQAACRGPRRQGVSGGEDPACSRNKAGGQSEACPPSRSSFADDRHVASPSAHLTSPAFAGTTKGCVLSRLHNPPHNRADRSHPQRLLPAPGSQSSPRSLTALDSRTRRECGRSPRPARSGGDAIADIDCNSHSDGRKIGSHSSVFICARNTRSKSGLPEMPAA